MSTPVNSNKNVNITRASMESRKAKVGLSSSADRHSPYFSFNSRCSSSRQNALDALDVPNRILNHSTTSCLNAIGGTDRREHMNKNKNKEMDDT